jgi:hypothetical protein
MMYMTGMVNPSIVSTAPTCRPELDALAELDQAERECQKHQRESDVNDVHGISLGGSGSTTPALNGA